MSERKGRRRGDEKVAPKAERTLAIFPLRERSKRPAYPWTGPASNRRFGTPQEYAKATNSSNIGLRTGNGFFVIDVDIGEETDGYESLARFESQLDELPRTTTVLTGMFEKDGNVVSGRHFWFFCDENVYIPSRPLAALNAAWAGIDIKGDGGYVVAPPSVHASGCVYEFEVGLDEIAPAPAWLVELLRGRPPREDGCGIDAATGLRRRSGSGISDEVAGWVFGPMGIPHPQWPKLARCFASLWGDLDRNLAVKEIADLVYEALIRSADYDPGDPWSRAQLRRDASRFLSRPPRGRG